MVQASDGKDRDPIVIRPDAASSRGLVRTVGLAIVLAGALGVFGVVRSGDTAGAIFVAVLVAAIGALFVRLDRGVGRMSLRVSDGSLESIPALSKARSIDRRSIARVVLVDAAQRPRAAPTAAVVAAGADGRSLWWVFAGAYSRDDLEKLAESLGMPVQRIPTATYRQVTRHIG